MQNQETWKFAHQYWGRLCFRLGWILLVLSSLTMVVAWFLLDRNISTIGIYGGILVMLQLAGLVSPLFITEKALKKKFDNQK